MNTFRLPAPRLFAGFGTLTLLAGLGLLASRPAHTAGGPIAVTVANTPLVTAASDNPAKQPVQLQLGLIKDATDYTFYTVPAGKRLVIEYVNLLSNHFNDTDRYSLDLQTNADYTGFSLVPDGSPLVSASQKVLLYADAGSKVSGFFNYNGSNANPQILVLLSGYLVDAP